MSPIRRCGFMVCVAAWGVLPDGVHAAGPEASRAERMRFDPGRDAWVELPTPERGTPEGDLATARAQFAEEAYKSARKTIRAWLKEYADVSEHYPAALLLSARIDKALRRYDAAHETLRHFLDQFGRTDLSDEALVELFNIAEVYLGGVRRKVLGVRLLNAKDFAIDILDDISAQYPGTRIAQLALKAKADHFFREGDFSLAALEYDRLLRSFPDSRYSRYAQRRMADAALASFGGVLFDDTPLIEAEDRYTMYARRYSGLAEQEGIGLILQEIREKRAAKELEIGAYYQRTRHPRAAVFYYRSTIKHWPDTIAAKKAAQANASLAGVERDATIEAIESAERANGSKER